MATFSADVYQNEFLPDGGTDVHAIVTVACSGAGAAGQSEAGDAAEIVIVDTSGSMKGDNIDAAQRAAAAALDQMLDGVWFAVIAGNHQAQLAYPQDGRAAMVRMDDRTRAQARAAVGRLPGRRRHRDGHLARRWPPRLFAAVPSRHPAARHPADRRRQPARDPGAARRRDRGRRGRFQCDCRGVGVRLGGGRDAHDRHGPARHASTSSPTRRTMAADFAAMMQQSMGRGGRRTRRCGCGSRRARRCMFVRQVSPTVEDLTHRRRQVNPLTVSLPDRRAGATRRATTTSPSGCRRRRSARSSSPRGCSSRRRRRCSPRGWSRRCGPTTTNLTTRSTRRSPTTPARPSWPRSSRRAWRPRRPATRTPPPPSWAAPCSSPPRRATTRRRPGCARSSTSSDAGTGTVRLKKSVDKVDEMALDTASTKTTRIRG